MVNKKVRVNPPKELKRGSLIYSSATPIERESSPWSISRARPVKEEDIESRKKKLLENIPILGM